VSVVHWAEARCWLVDIAGEGVLECGTKGKSDAETSRSDSPRMVVFRSARLKGRCEDEHGSETYLNNNKAAGRLMRQVTAAAHLDPSRASRRQQKWDAR
jgi:hypothetical protein